MKTVSATDANRHFSKLLRDVRAGETVLVTARGKPVATIVPPDQAERPEPSASRKALLQRLRSQPAQNIPITWTRDDLYDD